MSGSSATHQPLRLLAIDKLLLPFNIDGETHELDWLVTKYNHPLICANQYATAFTGCASKDATNKLLIVSNRFPELQHCKRLLKEHNKASKHITVH